MVDSHRAVSWMVPPVSVLVVGLTGYACSAGVEQPADVPPPAHTPTVGSAEGPGPAPTASTDGSAEPSAAAEARPAPCPDDMVYVDGVYCSKWQRTCAKDEYEPSNHLTICHRFAAEQTCTGSQRRQRFCVDRYEYPSRKGAHPPVMVSAYDAAAMCAEKGKRMCWESEWITACEGPDHLPFPYGLERDNKKCNIDRPWKRPSLKKVHGQAGPVRDRELARIDQSVPSGSMETCQSGYGVFDLTGNQDEWVLAERKRGTSDWVGLKGGNWHHVRNACRPVTTSHAPQWSYYFVSFRCCKDPDPQGIEPVGDDGKPALWTPPPAPTPAPPGGGKIHRGWPAAP